MLLMFSVMSFGINENTVSAQTNMDFDGEVKVLEVLEVEDTELVGDETVKPMILPALVLRLLITTGAKKGAQYTVRYSASAAQLQKKYKHAKDFGVTGNYNLINRTKFENALRNHVDDSTEIYLSRYSGDDVFVFVKGDKFVYTKTSGDFISGWKYTSEQIKFHRTNGMKAKKN
jgi:hypothetical protein